MKKTIITLAIILGIALGASAQNGGLFGKCPSRDMDYEYGTFQKRPRNKKTRPMGRVFFIDAT